MQAMSVSRRFVGLVVLCTLLAEGRETVLPGLLPRAAASEGGWITLFQDDFSTGSDSAWDFEAGWGIVRDDGNFVLSGSGRKWARLRQRENWTDYSFKFRIKLTGVGVHLNYRVSDAGRYFLGFGENGAVLRKETPWGTFQEQAGYSGYCTPGAWHDLELQIVGGTTRFYVDGTLRLDSTDTSPLASGDIAFETLEESQAYIDDILVLGAPPPALFPIATTSGAEASVGLACDGTNYLAGIRGDAANDGNITAQLFSSLGARIGNAVAVGRTGQAPAVAFDGSNYLLVWEDDATAPNDDIHGQFISPAGLQVGSPFVISAAVGGQRNPKVAFDGSRYLVVWSDDRRGGGDTDVYGQMVTPSGVLSGGEMPIAATAEPERNPTVACDGGAYLAAWSRRRAGSPGYWDACGSIVSLSGTVGSALLISQNPSASEHPLAIAFHGVHYLVTWNRDIGPGAPAAPSWDVYGRLVSPAATLPAGEFPIVTAAGDQLVAGAATDGIHYLIAWNEIGAGEIRAKVFTPAGTSFTGEFPLFQAVDNKLPATAQVAFHQNQFVAVATFSTSPPSFAGGDVYGRFLSRGAGPRLSIAKSGTEAILSWPVSAGRLAVESTTNLPPNGWTDLRTDPQVLGLDNTVRTSTFGPGRFYRLAERTVLFQDDFDTGSDTAWNLQTGWGIVLDNGNFVLRGAERKWARLRQREDWTDYTLKFRVKILRGGVHLNYRVSGVGRYFLGFGEHGSVLRKEFPLGTYQELSGYSGYSAPGIWHDLEIRVAGGNMKFIVDGILRLDSTDASPLERGDIAFETLEDSELYFDNIAVFGTPSPRGLNWVKLCGPLGGLGYDVRIDPVNPLVMYVTDNFAGVAKSTDGGNTWTELNEGVTARSGPAGDTIPIFCLTIDPHNHNVIWAGALGVRGIFKSTNGGVSWVQKDQGVVEAGGITLRSFTIDPRDANTVYCGAELETGERGLEYARQKGKIYKTVDGGNNWFSVWAGDSLVRHIIVDPTDSRVVYAATGIFDREAYNADVPKGIPGGLGVLKSLDGGATWTPVNNGLSNLYVGYLTMHPTDRLTLYAATGNYATARIGEPSGLFVTHDGAQSWSKLIHEDYFAFTAARVSELNPSIVYAGTEKSIWRSEDDGATWQEFGKDDDTYGPPGVRAGIPIDLTIDPGNPYHIYINNYKGGVFQSHNGGATWQDSSAGYSGAELRGLARSPFNHNDVYVVGRSGPFRSRNAGASWEGIRYPEMYSIVEWYSIQTSPNDPEKVLAACEGQGLIILSTNGGMNWSQAFRHPANLGDVNQRHGFKAIRFAPSDARVIYAGMCRERNHINEGGNQPSFGIYVSNDGGATWLARNAGISALSALNIHDLAVHPQDPRSAYAASHDAGVFKTVNGGETWSPMNVGFGVAPPGLSVRALAIDPENPERLYAGVENDGLYLSLDGANSWRRISAGMDPWASIRSVAINPANPRIVVVGDWHSGIYQTSNGTAPWTYANLGLRTRAVTSLLYSKGGGVLYAATDGGGVFRACPDRDQDGLPDIMEDRNDNRVRDPGETDANLSDTDGDGVGDQTDAFPTDPDRR